MTAYATLGGVKRRMGITDTVDDEVLLDIIADVNLDVEDMTGRVIGPGTVTNELIDGYDAIEGGQALLYPKGIRAVTSFEVADQTGGTFSAVPLTDIVLRPSTYLRQPDWPAFEIWMTDVPTGDVATFPGGIDNLRMSASIGWAAIPSTLVSAAEVTVARTFNSSRGGFVEGSEDTGERNFRALWRGMDIRTVLRYKWKAVEID